MNQDNVPINTSKFAINDDCIALLESKKTIK